MSKIPFLDLFAGAGGFSLGFEMAGFDAFAAIESDKWACETFENNHPNTRVLHRDITKIDDDEIRDLFKRTNPKAMIGGPPCQGFSIANKQSGDPKDPRNSLFMDFVRFARVLKPKLVIMENVPNLLRARTQDGEAVIGVIENTLHELGYHVYSKVLRATDFGVPQIRSRLFVIASEEELSAPFPEPTHFIESGLSGSLFSRDTLVCPVLWDAISDLPPLNAGEGAEEVMYKFPPKNEYQKMLTLGSKALYNHKAMNHTKRMVERFSTMKWGDSGNDVPDHLKPRRRNSQEIALAVYDQNNRRMSPHTPCHTIAASFYANFVHPYQHRNFTAREGARIQSFPDHYRFFGKPTVVSHRLLARENRDHEKYLCQYSQIGNAVPPLMAKAVADKLINQLKWVRDVRSRKQSGTERKSPNEVPRPSIQKVS